MSLSHPVVISHTHFRLPSSVGLKKWLAWLKMLFFFLQGMILRDVSEMPDFEQSDFCLLARWETGTVQEKNDPPHLLLLHSWMERLTKMWMESMKWPVAKNNGCCVQKIIKLPKLKQQLFFPPVPNKPLLFEAWIPTESFFCFFLNFSLNSLFPRYLLAFLIHSNIRSHSLFHSYCSQFNHLSSLTFPSLSLLYRNTHTPIDINIFPFCVLVYLCISLSFSHTLSLSLHLSFCGLTSWVERITCLSLPLSVRGLCFAGAVA